MFPTLLFYAAFAIGAAACVVSAINVLHGYPWQCRQTERVTLVTLAVLGLAGVELTRRYWMVPVASWPTFLAATAAFCCVVTLVVLPAATYARSRRIRLSSNMPREIRSVHLDDSPRNFVGDGHNFWMLRLPGNAALKLDAHDWSVPLDRLPREMDGLSILHLTDLHFSRAYDRRYFEAVCDAASKMPADLVFVTGDLIDDPSCVSWIAPLLERLPGSLGRFAILGNHDHHHEVDPIAAAVAEAGFTVLDGETTLLDVNGLRVAIGGTCAPWGRSIPDDEIPDADFSLLLSHTPDLVYRSARQGWDFILAGHNHGGQIRLPVIGPVLMPSLYSRRFEHGFFRVSPSLMYVSMGVGAKHPIRYGCTPEISRFTLSSVAAATNPARAKAATVRA